jgi:Protein of unknown function (DUF2917)
MSGTRSRTWTPGSTETWHLATDATLRIHPHRDGVILRPESGVVLVTQSGDALDHVLVPGDELRLPRGGRVVAWALEAARLVVTVARRPERQPGSLARGPAFTGP